MLPIKCLHFFVGIRDLKKLILKNHAFFWELKTYFVNFVNLHEFLSYKSLFLFNLALFIIFWSLKIKTKIDGAIKISKQNYLKLFRKIICISPNNIKDENTFWIILGKFKDNRILNCAIFTEIYIEWEVAPDKFAGNY